MNKMVVISGLGVREYYRKNHGYKNENYFVSKKL
jgi:histone acetyltransferase (RNA polymerase elongator complex component)